MALGAAFDPAGPGANAELHSPGTSLAHSLQFSLQLSRQGGLQHILQEAFHLRGGYASGDGGFGLPQGQAGFVVGEAQVHPAKAVQVVHGIGPSALPLLAGGSQAGSYRLAGSLQGKGAKHWPAPGVGFQLRCRVPPFALL
jgi:hypothetical protein